MNETEQKIASTILLFEDSRVTGPSKLRVSPLPAADKGGNWEICGICDGIEPKTFYKIKGLLDSKENEAAWEACLEYVLANTAAVRKWIGNDQHPATEFFLRDHYFNSGARNTGKILQRALNDNGSALTVDGIVGTNTLNALHKILTKGDEKVFLFDLHTRRRDFYKSCKQFATFGKGWLRRCDEAYKFAKSLMEEEANESNK